ncbi:MAG TPA: zinc-dependent alcohol dehydrogenase family protein [Acidimicrobiia bacterium]|nr:zinc-dependent alcohol dehydrogenase family protein [Acidimicrobiia bacterium]
MQAWVVHRAGPIDTNPLSLVRRPDPDPGPGQVRVRVDVCGVCRTDLHLAEGDLPPRHPDVVPGHEIVGRVDARGPGAARFDIGARIGIAWLRHTCGVCAYCRRGDENLCVTPRFTGWDDDGGYAEYAVVDESFAYALPDGFPDVQAAPLLCSGIIGYRALRRSGLRPGGRLGIYGFGASAHLAAQIALHRDARVHVLTRSAEARRLALELGCSSARDASDAPPEPLDAAIFFAPVGELVPVAMRALDRGGTLSIAGIHLTDIPKLVYADELFEEKSLTSTTANTRRDGEELLALATRVPLRVLAVPYEFADAQHALQDLAHDRVTGAAVLQVRTG